MKDLSKIKTIVIVMMENRSFDHMLGYLSLPPFNRTDVDGLSNDPVWLSKYSNYDNGQAFVTLPSTNPYSLPDKFDPPHERKDIAENLGAPQKGIYPMNGFVSSIIKEVSSDSQVRSLVMRYFGAAQAPINHFFATNFTICDRWFCSLPAGTQPNRLMAMGGFSNIDNNKFPLDNQRLVYDWLSERKVPWRVYHQGIPFYAMMPKWIDEVLLDGRFRSLESLQKDIISTPPNKMPGVIFVEPIYGDAPHIGPSTDDHAPSGISDGQEFLMRVYNAVTASPSFWKNSVLIVTYDEHGGFFDHVSPPLIETNPPKPGMYEKFESLGVRVPAFVISPFVKRAGVCHSLFDHTSMLKLLGERFGQNRKYEEPVDSRNVESASEALDFSQPLNDPPPAPSLVQYLSNRPVSARTKAVARQETPLQKSFAKAVKDMKSRGINDKDAKFGSLVDLV